MTDSDWKLLEPSKYLRSLMMQKEWGKIIEELSSPTLPHYLLPLLRIPQLRHEIFKNVPVKKLVNILDNASESIRYQLLSIMVDEFDNDSKYGEVGREILSNLCSHPWAFNNKDLITLLAPEDIIVKAITKRVSNSQDWAVAFTDENPVSNAYNYYSININIRLVKMRRSFANIVLHTYITEMKKEQNTSLLCYLLTNVITLKDSWVRDPQNVSDLKEAFLSINPNAWISENCYSYFTSQSEVFLSGFSIPLLKSIGIIDDEFIFWKVLHRLAISADNYIVCLLKLYYNNNYEYRFPEYNNFINLIRTLANQGNDDAKTILERMINLWQSETPKEFVSGNETLLNMVIKQISQKSSSEIIIQARNNPILTYEQLKGILISTIEYTFSNKEAIVKTNANRYTDLVTSILKKLTGDIHNFDKNCLFYILDSKLRDKLIWEVLRHPGGLKPISYQIFTMPSYYFTGLALKIEDLLTMADVMPKAKPGGKDQFGFMTDRTVNFPPLPNSDTKKAEKCQCLYMHTFELALFREHLLTGADYDVPSHAFSQYHTFVSKVIKMASERKDAELAARAVDCYQRFCRMCASNLGAVKTLANSLYESIILTNEALDCFALAGVNAKNIYDSVVRPYVDSKQGSSYAIKAIYTLMHFGSNQSALASELARVIITNAINNEENLNVGYNNKIESIRNPEFESSIARAYNIVINDGCPLDEKYINKLIKNHKNMSIKYKYPEVHPNSQINIAPQSLYPEQHYDPEILYALLCIVHSYVTSYTYSLFHSKKTAAAKNLIQIICKEINSFDKINIKAPMIPNVEKVARKFSLQKMQEIANKFSFQMVLNVATAPVVTEYAKGTVLADLLINHDDFIAKMSSVHQFNPIDEQFYLQRNLEIPKVQLTPYSLLININAQIHPDDVAVFNKHNPQQSKTIVAPEEWMAPLYRWSLESILDKGPSYASTLLQYPQIFYNTVTTIVGMMKKCQVPKLSSLDLPAAMLALVIDDLCTPDKSPSEPSITKFNGINVQKKAPRRKPRVGQRVPEKPPGENRFQANLLMIAKLTQALRGAPTMYDPEPIYDALLKFFNQKPEEIKKRVGLNNAFKFASLLCEFMFEHADFGSDLKPADWALDVPKPLKIIFAMFGSEVFTHELASVVVTRLKEIGGRNERLAILSALTSLVCISLKDEKVVLSLHFRINIVSWCLCPPIVGSDIPDFVVDFIKLLCDQENLHIDVRRSITACSIAFFDYLERPHAPPNEKTETILAAIEKTCTGARDSLVPFVCLLTEKENVQSITSRAPAIAALIPRQSMPETFLSWKAEYVHVPREGAWASYYNRILANIVSQGLISVTQNVLQLTVQMLTMISASGDISKSIAPFLIRSLRIFDPSAGFVSLLSFAFSFCLNPANAEFEEVFTAMYDMVGRTRALFDEIAASNLIEFIKSSDATSSKHFAPLKIEFDEFKHSFCTALNRKGDLSYISNVAKKLLSATRDEDPMVKFDPLMSWIEILRIASLDEFVSCKDLKGYVALAKAAGARAIPAEIVEVLPNLSIGCGDIATLVEIPLSQINHSCKAFVRKIRQFVNYANSEALIEISKQCPLLLP